MDPVYWLLEKTDPFLIAPYRWLSDPIIGWWLGSAVLCLWCTILGEATLAVVKRVNRVHLERQLEQMSEGQTKSWEALQAGDRLAYKGFNTQANESFGKSFFMQVAMGSSSLWPAFLAMAWLQWRFWAGQCPLSRHPVVHELRHRLHPHVRHHARAVVTSSQTTPPTWRSSGFTRQVTSRLGPRKTTQFA